MKLVQSILTKNPCYTAGRKITVKGLMLHSVGCPQPKASVFINNWNSPSYDSACVHGFIDGNDGTVYQTLPWNHRGWHCGSGSKGSGNNTHIGVEMCEPACIREVFAMLCKQYNLNPIADGVIVSHREGHSRGIASNHGDPEHLWNGLGMGYTMDGFRKAVKAAMGGNAAGGGSSSGSGSSGISGFPAVPFTVKVLISDLNYRSAPSMSGSVKGQTGKGIFTIVEVKNGWGRLKSGAGWIYLENTSYCTVQSSGSGGSSSSGSILVQVSATDLNIRKGPGTNYGTTGKYTGKGTFTIVETRSGQGSNAGWGKLKSGAGWISLDYAKRV